MATRIEKTCEICHERPATGYTIYGDTGRAMRLCTTCFELYAAPRELRLGEPELNLRDAKCDYCGEPAIETSTHFEPGSGASRESWCAKCREDLIEFGKRPENAVPDFDVEDENALEQGWRLVEEIKRRRGEFIRQRVVARKRADQD